MSATNKYDTDEDDDFSSQPSETSQSSKLSVVASPSQTARPATEPAPKNGAASSSPIQPAAVRPATPAQTTAALAPAPAVLGKEPLVSIPARTGLQSTMAKPAKPMLLEKEPAVPKLEKEEKLEEPPAIVAPTPEEIRKIDETKNEKLSDVVFPESAYLGLGAKFAELYSKLSEPPKEFFYLEFLAQVGGMLSGSIRADFPYSVQPRLYLLKIGPAGWGRKSFTSEKVLDLIQKANSILNPTMSEKFGSARNKDNPEVGSRERFQKPLHIVYGAGSGEGLVTIFKSYHRVLFYLDELRLLEQKLAIEGSTLLTALIQLFNKNNYENRVLKNSIDIRDAHLVLSANTTTKNFETMMRGSEMVRSGFFGRVLLAANETEKRVTRSVFPENEIQVLAEELAEILRGAPSLDIDGLPTKEKVIPLTPEAFALWDDYYKKIERTEETERFDTYGQRLMAILAFTSGKSEIDVEVMQAVLAILEYEKTLREAYWPSEAETKEAEAEQKVLRVLKRKYPQELSAREIEQFTKLSKKYGGNIIDDALEVLIKRKEVKFVITRGKKVVKKYQAIPEEAQKT